MVRLRLAALMLATLAASAVAGAVPSSTAVAEPAEVMALSPEIERYIDARVRPDMPRTVRVRALMDALFGNDGLDIVYGNAETRTAAETFEARSGNCLSFTILFVALARHVGLEANFQEVGETLSWGRRGDVAVNNRHMFAEVETADGVARVDFLPGIEKRYRQVRRIDERRVVAHYYSNLGAEALTRDRPDLAMEMFLRALEADELLSAAWVNMGVTHRRLGRLDLAESAYLRALELDTREISAASNLAELYRATGRERLAAPYRRLVRKYQEQNPFYHFRRGLEAAEGGRLVAALRAVKKAVRLLPEDVLFRAELGKLQARAGRPWRAQRTFRRALRLSADDDQRALLVGLLENIGGDAGAGTA